MESHHPKVDLLAVEEFATAAKRFCRTIEQREDLSEPGFRQKVHTILPELYVAALRLPSTDILFEAEVEDSEDYDTGAKRTDDPDRLNVAEWRDLYTALSDAFGPRNHYREIFDPYDFDDQEEVVGSLADDIADIYNDLRSGVLKWSRGHSGEALWEWRFNFEVHWGDHLTSALRALHAADSSGETLPHATDAKVGDGA